MVAPTVHLLGTPHTDSGAVVRGHKPWALVAYLALERQPVRRDRLTSLLFAMADDPAGALRWNLAQVRRLLGVPSALRGPALTLPAEVPVDVATVLRGRWQDAVALPALGADLLEGLQFADAPGFEMWLVGSRRRLAAATEAILHDAAVASLAAGKSADGVAYAATLVALAPLDDDHQELLVRAYAATGDARSARRHLEAAIRLFRAELGCDPAPRVFLAAARTRAGDRREPSVARTRALLEAGQAQVLAGAIDTAVRVLAQGCDEAAATGDVCLQATAQFTLGAALVDAGIGRHQDAEVALHTAIALATQAGDRRTATAAYRRLAAADLFRGSYGRALARLDEAERLHDGSSDERVELSALRGVALVDLGQRSVGLAELQRAVDADPTHTHGFLPILLTHVGRAQLLNGDLAAAQAQLEHAQQLAASRGWAAVTPGPRALLGHVALLQGDRDRAADLLADALAAAAQVGDPCWETWAAHGQGRLAAARGDTAAALAHYSAAERRSDPARGGHLWSRVWALTHGAAVARAAGDDRAARWHGAALRTAQRTGMSDLREQLEHH
jgi:DNA-binding SARP family transcriptional activator